VLTLTGYAPTVTTSANQTIQVPSGALTLTGYAPTVTFDNNQTVEVPAGALTLTGFAPEVLGVTRIIEVPLGTLTLTGHAPTVSNGTETGSSGGKKRKRRQTMVGAPYTHDDYVQWVVRTVAAVAATGAFDA
jgi:hypothetical protein